MSQTHLKELLQQDERNKGLVVEDKEAQLILDYTHTKIDATTLNMLFKVAEEQRLTEKLSAMFKGETINTTEGRCV